MTTKKSRFALRLPFPAPAATRQVGKRQAANTAASNSETPSQRPYDQYRVTFSPFTAANGDKHPHLTVTVFGQDVRSAIVRAQVIVELDYTPRADPAVTRVSHIETAPDGTQRTVLDTLPRLRTTQLVLDKVYGTGDDWVTPAGPPRRTTLMISLPRRKTQGQPSPAAPATGAETAPRHRYAIGTADFTARNGQTQTGYSVLMYGATAADATERALHLIAARYEPATPPTVTSATCDHGCIDRNHD